MRVGVSLQRRSREYSARRQFRGVTAGGSELELTNRIYRAAFDNIQSQPHLFAWGYLKGFIHYLGKMFNFVRFIPLRAVFIALWMLGLAVAWRRRRDQRLSLLLWVALSVFLSSPFLTFNGGYRVYAVTFPAEAILAGLGMAALQALIARRGLESAARLGPAFAPSHALIGVALAVVLISFIPPSVARFMTPAPALAVSACPQGEEAIVVRPGYETPVLTVVEEGAELIYPLQVSAEDFARRIDRWTFDPDALRKPPGTAFIWGFPLDAEHKWRPILFVWQGEEPVPRGKPVQFCVQREVEKVGHRFSIAKSMIVPPEAAP